MDYYIICLNALRTEKVKNEAFRLEYIYCSRICLKSFNQLLFVFVSQEEIYLSIGLIFHKLTLSGQTIQVTQYRPRYTIVKTLVQNVLQLSDFLSVRFMYVNVHVLVTAKEIS